MPKLIQNLHILTKPKMTYFDEQWAITLEGMVRYVSYVMVLNNVINF